jgi:hypothetical protein
MANVKLPASVGMSKFVSGEWKLKQIKDWIEEGLLAAPSRPLIDQMVESNEMTDDQRNQLIKAEVISAKASVAQVKREFVNQQQKDVYDLFVKGNNEFSNFIKGNEILQTIARMEFIDKDGEPFKVIPSHYLKNSAAAIDSFEKTN